MNQQTKQLPTLFKWLPLLMVISIFLTSCSNKIIKIPIPSDNSELGKINHLTSRQDIDAYRENFKIEKEEIKKLRPDFIIPSGEAFNKKDLLRLLSNPNCIGIRIFYGAKPSEGNNKTGRLLIVGVDRQGNDLYLKVDDSELNKNRNQSSIQKGRGPQVRVAPLTEVEAGLQNGQCINPPCNN
jgi:hypothetical protein